MEERKLGWIAYSELYDKDKKLKPCRICGGEVIKDQTTNIIECRDCKILFREKRYMFLTGFDMIQRK
jgi:ribosomal protein L37AE/L43A